MSDEKKTAPLTLTDPHKVPVTFVNEVAVWGVVNGVANLTLATAQFSQITPAVDSPIAADLVVSARLRMDLFAVQKLRDALTSILDQNTKPGKMDS